MRVCLYNDWVERWRDVGGSATENLSMLLDPVEEPEHKRRRSDPQYMRLRNQHTSDKTRRAQTRRSYSYDIAIHFQTPSYQYVISPPWVFKSNSKVPEVANAKTTYYIYTYMQRILPHQLYYWIIYNAKARTSPPTNAIPPCAMLLAAAFPLELGLAELAEVAEPPTTVVAVVLVVPTVDWSVVVLEDMVVVGAAMVELEVAVAVELEVLDAIAVLGIVELADDVTAVTVEAEALELADEEDPPVMWNG
jgi:hypothetical protein